MIINSIEREKEIASYLKLIVVLLEKGMKSVQKQFFEFIKNDKENKFLITIRNFLDINLSDLVHRETILTLINPKDISGKKPNMDSIVGIENDLMHKSWKTSQFDPEKTSSELIELVYNSSKNVILGIEVLRLLCEHHYDSMQNLLRVQYNGNVLRSTQVNLIKVISELLTKYLKVINI